jgi:NAD(P)-dependent dehydrogenase (short-subunit alcohol dehydrogenase family)
MRSPVGDERGDDGRAAEGHAIDVIADYAASASSRDEGRRPPTIPVRRAFIRGPGVPISTDSVPALSLHAPGVGEKSGGIRFPSMDKGSLMTTSQKIALVTGATRGIGTETVRQLAQAGVLTLLAGRDAGRAKAAADKLVAEGLSVEPIVLDVTNAESIAKAVAEVTSRFGKLDILVNNAGIMVDDMSKAPSEQTLAVWRETFDTNVFAVVEVTQAFLPLLKKADAARIVNVSSQLGSLALHLDPASPIYSFKVPAYDASKTAINAWTIHLAYELRDTAIKVNAIHPGYVQTEMNGGQGEIDVPTGAKSSVGMALIGADGPTGSFTYLGKTLPW